MLQAAKALIVCAALAVPAPRADARDPADDLRVDAGETANGLRADAGESADDVPAAIDGEDYARAAELLRAELARAPEDEAARFLLARVLGWAGDYRAAISEYDRLIARSPDNVDYSLGRAQVLAWAGRDSAALEELGRARLLAPAYEDVWRLELAVLERGTDANRLARLRDAAARAFPNAAWWRPRAQAPPADSRTELRLGAVHETLSTAVPDWRSVFLQVTRSGGAASTWYAALRREERFGRSDVVIGGGGGWKLSERWSTGLDLDIGGDADFLPRVSVAGWAGRALPSGWETQLRVRQRRYSTAKVTSAAATLGRYFGDFRAAYTFDYSRLHGEAGSAAHSATLNYYHSPGVQWDLTVARGQEAEAIAPGRVLRTDVTSFSLGARHALSDRWGLSWWLGSHRQGELYRRRYVGLSLATGL